MSFSDFETSVDEPSVYYTADGVDISIEEAEGILRRYGIPNSRVLASQTESKLYESVELTEGNILRMNDFVTIGDHHGDGFAVESIFQQAVVSKIIDPYFTESRHLAYFYGFRVDRFLGDGAIKLRSTDTITVFLEFKTPWNESGRTHGDRKPLSVHAAQLLLYMQYAHEGLLRDGHRADPRSVSNPAQVFLTCDR